MISFKEKIFIVFIQVISVVGLSLPSLNFIIAYDLAKRYKNRSKFISNYFVELANFNLVFLLYLVLVMFVVGLFHIVTSYQFEGIIKNFAKIILIVWIGIYLFQMIFGVFSILVGKSYKYQIWPKLLTLD